MSKRKDEPKCVELSQEEMSSLQERLAKRQLSDKDYELLQQTLMFVSWLQTKLLHASISLKKLRCLFGFTSNRRRQVNAILEGTSNEAMDGDGDDGGGGNGGGSKIPQNTATTDSLVKQEKVSHNNGRNPSSAYQNKEIITVTNIDYKPGDLCPLGCGGRLYIATPGVIIKVTGQNNFYVTEYHIEKLRCALCGELFPAVIPEAALGEKYDAKFKSNLALQKYYNATPFYTLDSYHSMLGLPLPDATQWKLVESVAHSIVPVYDLLCYYIAQGQLLYYDDTWLRILAVIAEGKKDAKNKRGCYTTGFVGSYQQYPIRLFMSGDNHAGNNLSTLLKNRHKDLQPIQTMSDALAANVSHGLKVIICNCFAHALRKFKEIAIYYEAECSVILTALDSAYKSEDVIKAKKLNDAERLAYHQEHTLPTLTKLHQWLNEQQEKYCIEPNSHLGAAVSYLLKHWPKLLQFCQIPGAPIDNNICEQLLKIAIRIRKTSYFHKTIHGAKVAAQLLSIIYTCRCHKVNPADYLAMCQENHIAVRINPAAWLPWNYHENIVTVKKAA